MRQGRSGRSIALPAFRGRAGGAGAGTRLGANQVSRAIETPERGPMIFRDRQEAGWRLGNARLPYRAENVYVLAIPRGGVVVGAAVARVLGVPLDVIVPGIFLYALNPHLPIGALR